jgi:hypothetical protein
MRRFNSYIRRSSAARCAAPTVAAALLLVLAAPASADVVRNSGGGTVGQHQTQIVCEIDPDYIGASKPPDVDPVIVAGIATKDDTGGFNPARIGSITYDNGVDPLIVYNRGDLPGLTPAHEELDNMQINRIELWALPFIPVPPVDSGLPLRLRMTFIDENGDPLVPTDQIAGCALFNGVRQDRPVTGHGGGDVGFPGTDFAFSMLPCTPDGMAVDAVGVNGNIVIDGPAQPGQTPGAVDLETGNDADALRVQSSFKVTDDVNCVDGLTFMAWNLAEPTTWVTAALTLEPEEDCYVALQIDRKEVRPGDVIQVSFKLQHNRWQPVTVPIRFSIESAFGDQILEIVTAPRTFEHGDRMRKTFRIHIPHDIVPGPYELIAGAERMQQGFGWASARFKVLDD